VWKCSFESEFTGMILNGYPCSKAEGNAVQEWRTRVQDQITERISAFDRLLTDSSRPSKPSSLPSPNRILHTEHRLFRITELLGLILKSAGPEVQVQALAVSALWRSSAIDIIGSQKNTYGFRSLPGQDAIQYGQVISSHCDLPYPTSDQLEDFFAHIETLILVARRGGAGMEDIYTYIPAYCTQLCGCRVA
jgi:hypothetical protein